LAGVLRLPNTNSRQAIFGLQRNQLANEIKGGLSPRFARMPLIEQVITGTLNHRVPGSSPGAPTIAIN